VDRSELVKKLFEIIPLEPFYKKELKSYSIDDEYGAEAYEDGRVRIIGTVDGETQEIGWRNPDGITFIRREDGEYDAYDSNGEPVYACVEGEDYFSQEYCLCSYPEGQPNASLFSSTANQAQQTVTQRTEPVHQPEAQHSIKDKTPLTPPAQFTDPAPVHGVHVVTHPMPVVTTHGVVLTTNHESQVSSSPVLAGVSPNIAIAAEAGGQVFACASSQDPSSADGEVESPSTVHHPVVSDDGAILCFTKIDGEFEAQRMQEASGSRAQHGSLEVEAQASGQAGEGSVPVNVDLKRGAAVRFRDADVVEEAPASVVGSGVFVGGDDGGAATQRVSVIITPDGAIPEGDPLAGAAVGTPPQLMPPSQSGVFSATSVALNDSTREVVRAPSDPDASDDQGNPDSNKGEQDQEDQQDQQDQA